MAILRVKQIKEMNEKEKKEKLKELRRELARASMPGKSKMNVKEIKKTIARILTLKQ